MIYFIPTPIGNLEDTSQRALKLLQEVSLIFCEDTRITKKLLFLLEEKYNLSFSPKTYISLHSHNEKELIHSLHVKELKEKKSAYMSDAGMPGISDPGALLVQFCQKNAIPYEVLPGANALLLAYVASGFADTKFSFFGFLPHKGKEREIALKNALNHPLHVIIYESPHRILMLFEEIARLDEKREVFAIKEATKKHETKFFGNAKEILEKLKQTSTKGEWSIVIKKPLTTKKQTVLTCEDILPLSLPPKQKAKLLAKVSEKSVSFWYEKLKND